MMALQALPSALWSSFHSLNVTTLLSPVMHSFVPLVALGGLAVQTIFAFPEPSRVREREAKLLKRSVDSFIATESPIALANLLCNVGAGGSCAAGADAGIVIASPDKVNPDCMLQNKRSLEFF